jgi:hypothetical protein
MINNFKLELQKKFTAIERFPSYVLSNNIWKSSFTWKTSLVQQADALTGRQSIVKAQQRNFITSQIVSVRLSSRINLKKIQQRDTEKSFHRPRTWVATHSFIGSPNPLKQVYASEVMETNRLNHKKTTMLTKSNSILHNSQALSNSNK